MAIPVAGLSPSSVPGKSQQNVSFTRHREAYVSRGCKTATTLMGHEGNGIQVLVSCVTVIWRQIMQVYAASLLADLRAHVTVVSL